MVNKCPFFGICGGCKYDFASADYKSQKSNEIKHINASDAPIWIPCGMRRRADFAFAPGKFGFFATKSKDIIKIDACNALIPEINQILPYLTQLPWECSGACLVTLCDNGIDVAITSNVPYFSPEFRDAVLKVPAIRITWNDKVIKQTQQPKISFGEHSIDYPSGAFLQPSVTGADTLRQMVFEHANGFSKIADLFCGLGNFTFALNAHGFDIVGVGAKRDLFKKPLTIGMLNQYDCVVMDPPRAGALAQCQELVRSNIKRIIYISCNPTTFLRDADVLTHGGYKTTKLVPVDQFPGSSHWEIFSVFDK